MWRVQGSEFRAKAYSEFRVWGLVLKRIVLRPQEIRRFPPYKASLFACPHNEDHQVGSDFLVLGD